MDDKGKNAKIIENINNSKNHIISTINNIRESMKQKIKIPVMNLDDYKLPEISKISSPLVIQEKNNWKRHEETIKIQENVLKIQENILKEQKSTSIMTLIILILTIVSIIVSIIAVLKAFSII
jgi:hypothetical protein